MQKGKDQDMNKSLKLFIAAGVILVSALGALSHFVYEWTGQNRLAGLFVPVSESIWEHMKLLFFPMLLTALFLTVLLKRTYPHILTGMLAGLLTGTAAIPVLFYTYSGVLGYCITAVDIAIFYISAGIGFFVAYRLTISVYAESLHHLLCCLTLLMFAAFVLFSYEPPTLGIFAEPEISAAFLGEF